MAPEFFMGRVCGDDGNYTALTNDSDFQTGACVAGMGGDRFFLGKSFNACKIKVVLQKFKSFL